MATLAQFRNLLKKPNLGKYSHIPFLEGDFLRVDINGTPFIRLSTDVMIDGQERNISANFRLSLMKGLKAEDVQDAFDDNSVKELLNSHFPNGHKVIKIESWTPMGSNSEPVKTPEGELVLKFGSPYYMQRKIVDNVPTKQDVLLTNPASVQVEAESAY